MLIHQILLKKANLAGWKSDADQLDIGKLRNLTSGLSNFKSKVDKLDTNELETTPLIYNLRCSKR